MTYAVGQMPHAHRDSRENCAMTSAVAKQKPIKKTIRFPPNVLDQVEAARQVSGRTLNEEVVERARTDEIALLRSEVAELKTMLREVLDRVRE